MSAGRAFLQDHARAYRVVLEEKDGLRAYRGPYGTIGAAKGQATSWLNSYGGRTVRTWVEQISGAWEEVWE